MINKKRDNKKNSMSSKTLPCFCSPAAYQDWSHVNKFPKSSKKIIISKQSYSQGCFYITDFPKLTILHQSLSPINLFQNNKPITSLITASQDCFYINNSP